MGLGIFSVSAFLGLTIGVLICPFIKSKEEARGGSSANKGGVAKSETK